MFACLLGLLPFQSHYFPQLLQLFVADSAQPVEHVLLFGGMAEIVADADGDSRHGSRPQRARVFLCELLAAAHLLLYDKYK